MRALFVAAAVVLSVTAAHAQEVKPAATVAQESADRAVPPQATSTSSIIEQLKVAGEIKDPKTLEAPAPKIDAVDAKPAEAKPVEAKPAEVQPVVAQPVEAKSVETAKPAETKPAETKAVETKPVETKPAEAAEAMPVKKRVVKRETDEQKARRIAAKYGMSW